MFPQYHAAVNVSNVSNVSNVWCCRSSYVQDSSEDDGLVRPAHSHHSTPSHRSSLWSWWLQRCWWWLQRWWWWWSRALNSLNAIAQVIVMVLIMTIVVVMLTIIIMVAIDNDDKRWACKYWYCHTGNQHGAPREASKVPESLRGECCFHYSDDLRSDVKPLMPNLCFDRISDHGTITGLETQGSMTIAIVAVADSQVSAAGEFSISPHFLTAPPSPPSHPPPSRTPSWPAWWAGTATGGRQWGAQDAAAARQTLPGDTDPPPRQGGNLSSFQNGTLYYALKIVTPSKK